MFHEEPKTSLRDLLLSSWSDDKENSCDSHHPSYTPKVLCYSDTIAGSTRHGEDQIRIRRILENCEQYVLNYFPTYLLRVSDMSLVTRSKFWELEKGRVQTDLEGNLEKFVKIIQDNENDITANANDGSREKRLKRPCSDEAVETDTCIRELCKFAIFSHRWGDKEPQFYDILDKPLHETRKYSKLQSFCEKACTDFDCRYVWSDTCCINKESSVELDEAIRSMYRWYAIATVCIVYLAGSSSTEDFISDAWFTRGWTLQELLAPRVIRFYGKDWKPIHREANRMGDKAIKEIWTAIESVTGIPSDDLWHFSPSCDRIAEKMTWASRRKTTKVEDVAYSLLGLFDVSLPIAYGEGDKSWYRLMCAIANECTDASFFAWAGQPSPYSRAFPSSPASYSRLDHRTSISIFRRLHPSYQVTKLGVSIKMIMISMRCHVLEDSGGQQVGYTVIPNCLETFLVGSVRSDLPHGRIQEYRLGIVNFRLGGHGRPIEVGDECHCLVLAKDRFDDHTDQGWIMVNTECVIVARCLKEIPESPETILLYHDVLRPSHIR